MRANFSRKLDLLAHKPRQNYNHIAATGRVHHIRELRLEKRCSGATCISGISSKLLHSHSQNQNYLFQKQRSSKCQSLKKCLNTIPIFSSRCIDHKVNLPYLRTTLYPFQELQKPFSTSSTQKMDSNRNPNQAILTTTKPGLAVAQITSTGDIEHNFEQCERIVKESAHRGIQLISFPECFAFIGSSFEETKSKSEPLDGPLFSRYRKLAHENNIWISYGGFHEKKANSPDEKIFNSHVIVDNAGEIRAVYRKAHLFSVDLSPDGPKLNENALADPGHEIVLCQTPVGVLGLTICYDLRFPELNIILRQAGAEIILVPSAFTKETGRDHWNTLLKATAIYTQCYVAAAAQYGTHNPKRSSYGRALIVDPWGTEIAQASDYAPAWISADLNNSYLQQVRKNLPCFSHRRIDLYGDLYAQNTEKIRWEGK